MSRTYWEVAIAILVAIPLLEAFCAISLKYHRMIVYCLYSLLILACSVGSALVVGNWASDAMTSGIYGPFIVHIFIPMMAVNIWLVSAATGFSYVFKQQLSLLGKNIDEK